MEAELNSEPTVECWPYSSGVSFHMHKRPDPVTLPSHALGKLLGAAPPPLAFPNVQADALSLPRRGLSAQIEFP